MADVHEHGDLLELRDFMIFPNGTARLTLSPEKVRSLYRVIADEAAALGFKKLRITGDRITVASPGRHVDLVRRLR